MTSNEFMNYETDEQTDNTPAPAKIYPEQENPPRPTYAATIRGISIYGFLYYLPDGLLIKVKYDNGTGEENQPEHEWQYSPEDTESGAARAKAKRAWKQTVLAVLQGV
jgi:hypothetical protein